jgi:dihydropteroate synthase
MLHNSLTNYSKTIQCGNHSLSLQTPVVMGILNTTPDSFYIKSRVGDDADYIAVIEKMITDGATIIDIGGQSTRPNATLIDVENELQRVVPIIKNMAKHFPNLIISVDTFYAKVAYEAVQNGATMINDVSGGMLDSKLFETVAALKVPYILMHNNCLPNAVMATKKYDNLIKNVLDYFIEKINILHQLKVADIIIDLGFGFAKSTEQNFELLNRMKEFVMLEKPILAGLSRKSMIYKTLNTDAENALNGTTVLNTIALQNGAKILRVHDVKQAMETIILFDKLNSD